MSTTSVRRAACTRRVCEAGILLLCSSRRLSDRCTPSPECLLTLGLDSTWEPTLERTGSGGTPFAGRACKHALTDPMPTHAVGLGQARVEAFR